MMYSNFMYVLLRTPPIPTLVAEAVPLLSETIVALKFPEELVPMGGVSVSQACRLSG